MTDKSFWDRAADKYVANPISDMDAYEAGLRRTASHLSKDMRVIEIGCGSGMTARRLAPFVARLTATDLSPAMIEHARRLHDLQEASSNIEYRIADLDTIVDRTGDAVLCFSLLHLLPDLTKGLAQIHRLLPPGGLFISKTPCLGGAWSVLRLIIGPMRLMGKAPSKVHFFTVEQLQQRIGNAGFQIVEADKLPGKPPRGFIVARRL